MNMFHEAQPQKEKRNAGKAEPFRTVRRLSRGRTIPKQPARRRFARLDVVRGPRVWRTGREDRQE